jgi:hypothetical protein
MQTLLNTAHADRRLATRLEAAEGRANAAMVRTRAALQPDSGAASLQVAGAHVLFDGAGSPLTQTFGLGMDRVPDDAEISTIEAFFIERGAAVCHELCPLADAALPALLATRGYRPVEHTNVLFQPVDDAEPPDITPRHLTARTIAPDEAELWAKVAAAGWGARSPQLGNFMEQLGAVTTRCPGVTCFLAELDGWPIATGTLIVRDGVGLLAGSSTVPRHRRRGAQTALLSARLAFAAAQSCDVAMIVTAPGSDSQRNAERAGFRVAYTRTKWCLDIQT